MCDLRSVDLLIQSFDMERLITHGFHCKWRMYIRVVMVDEERNGDRVARSEFSRDSILIFDPQGLGDPMVSTAGFYCVEWRFVKRGAVSGG